VHAEDDQDIPVWHAQMLFDAFVEKHLPQEPEMVSEVMTTMNASVAGEVKENFGALLQQRAVRRGELVTVHEMERVGRVEVFSRNRPDGKVAYLQTRWGKHNVGSIEGVQDYMAEMFNMG
jgi:abhydrolase domain-containing protein 12